jgi:hypothetical protein
MATVVTVVMVAEVSRPGRLFFLPLDWAPKLVNKPCALRSYAGHSLRAGLATFAAFAGASERAITNQTWHRSSAMVRRHIRDGSLFRENPAAKVGM